MHFIISLVITILFFLPSSNYAQSKDLFKEQFKFNIITNIAATAFSSQLYLKEDLDDKSSEKIFNKFFDTLDPMKIYLSKEDIERFATNKTKIDDQLKKGDSSFAFEVFEFFLKRIDEFKYYSLKYAEEKIDFTKDEYYVFKRRKIERVNDINGLKELWRKRIKNEYLSIEILKKADKLDKENGVEDDEEDELKEKEKTPKEKVIKSIESISKAYQNLERFDILEFYLTSHAKTIDPHSAYMSPASEEDFNIHMQLSLGGIGAMLTSKDGYTEIVELILGGPAEKGGELKEKDRIIAVAQGDEEPVNIVNMSLNKVVRHIRGKKGTIVKLTVTSHGKGANSRPHIVSIKRDIVDLSQSSGAQSKIKTVNINGVKKRIGIIDLPSFYIDFQARAKGEDYKSSTKDIRKILNEFSEKNIDGVIVDLRNNGGGSLLEAITLTGLFINKGPVVQVKEQNGQIKVNKDRDPSILYEGPLGVMVNKNSASASEIFAGAIKDYKRGIIIGGERTHGKGSVQTVLDISQILASTGMQFNAGSIKYTNAMFFRINGSSTQVKGVESDIILNSYYDVMKTGEGQLPHALPWSSIDEVGHEIFINNLDKIINTLKEKSSQRVSKNEKFVLLKDTIKAYKKIIDKNKISLNLKTRWAEYLEDKEVFDKQKKYFKAEADKRKATKKKTDKSKKDKNSSDKSKEDKKKEEDTFYDMYITEACDIMVDYINELKK